MSCKYCSDKYDGHRTRKFGYERGDDFTTDNKYYRLHIERVDNNVNYIVIEGSYNTDIFKANYCHRCGEKLK